MTRWISVGLVGVLAFLVGTAGSAPAQSRSPFPLAEGNRWTHRGTETNFTRTMLVRGQADALVLSGLPGAPPLRVRWLGETVQAWDSGNDRWEALFRFGEPARSSYRVNLANAPLWRNLVVTVDSKRAPVEYAGRMRLCTRFSFATKSKIVDAGLESMSFAPGVGPVLIAEQTIAGTRELELTSHRVK